MIDEFLEDEKIFNQYGFTCFEPDQLEKLKKERAEREGSAFRLSESQQMFPGVINKDPG